MKTFVHKDTNIGYQEAYSDSWYDALDFTVKDCFYGQVRAVNDNLFADHNITGEYYSHSLPDTLKPFVTKQQAMTWDNVTGMNPMWDKSPIEDTKYFRYGDMLKEAHQRSTLLGLSFVPSIIEDMRPHSYEIRLKADHNSPISMLCLALGWWWHIDKLLREPDALDYDYTAFRQFDTWYWPMMDKERVYKLFEYSRRQVLLAQEYEETNIPYHDIPVIWGCGAKHAGFPLASWINSYFLMFNRATVELFREDFFDRILQEIEIHFMRGGPYSKFILRKPGCLIHNIAIKNDVPVLDIIDDTYCWIPHGRDVATLDWAHTERSNPFGTD